VQKVFYAGLTDHPGHEIASKQQKGFGGIVAFRIRGGREAAWKLINSTRLLSITANLGDVKTTITHPASTTHAKISQKQRDQAGVTDDLIRVSVGIENIGDIIADIGLGLANI
jgi:O-succinylhomoserine sulfhydrylase